MVREVASKTSDIAGDGTTTATVLAQAIYREGIKNVTAGANPMELKRGIELAVKAAVEAIDKLAKPVEGKDIAHIGTISANNDDEIGNIIAEAMEKVGKDGVITVEEARGLDTVLEVVEGMQFDRGYLSPYFVTDPERMEVGPRERQDPHLREEDLLDEGPPPDPRAGRPSGQAAPHHRRRRRGRGAGHARRQQAARHAQRGRRQGARLRRPPQGHARRHRHPHRRQADLRGPRHQAREREVGRPRRREARHRSTRTTPRSSPTPTTRRARKRSPAASSRSAPRSTTPPPTTTARSSRSAWPSSSAALPSSRSAPRPRPR